MPYRHRHVVRFHEVDPARLIFYGRLFEICHDAFEEALASIGFPLADVFAERAWAMPIVHADADYRLPIRLGDPLDIDVSVEKIGQSSLIFAFRVLGADGSERARARQVHACIDREAGRSRPLPQELRAALGPLLA